MIEYFSSFYFTVVVQLILNLLFIFYSILFIKKIKKLYLLLIYSILSLLKSLYSCYVHIFGQFDHGKEKAWENALCLFMSLEFIFFYLFIIRSISVKRSKLFFKTVFILFLCLLVFHWVSPVPLLKGIGINVIAAYLVIIACLYYYYETFLSPPAIKLADNPVFWSITGMFFLSIIIIPIFLQKETIYIKSCLVKDSYPLTFIGYTILFVLFINALRCQIQLSA